MRELFSFVMMTSALALCGPAAALEARRCALDAASAFKMAQQDAVKTPRAGDEIKADAVVTSAAGAAPIVKEGLGAPADVEQIPVLKHVAASGATLLDLGAAHGLRGVSARNGGQFMILQVTPDGEAVIGGPQLDLSVARLMTIAGARVTELGETHGLRGLYLRNGQDFQVLYATPDGQATIAGVMWDAAGKNLTRDQVASIDGAIPTVVVDKDVAAPAPDAPKPPALGRVEQTAFGVLGDTRAPRLWLFVDPLCSFSVRALQELQPFVTQGRVQLAIVPISILDYEDKGQSTRSALALLSQDPARMAETWSHRNFSGQPAPEASERLRKNLAIAEEIKLTGTPTLVWRKPDGSEGRVDGMPNDWNKVLASIEGDRLGSAR
jgi:thiol:disulfide interchange protein DsbG